jgi:hypothetical protein
MSDISAEYPLDSAFPPSSFSNTVPFHLTTFTNRTSQRCEPYAENVVSVSAHDNGIRLNSTPPPPPLIHSGRRLATIRTRRTPDSIHCHHVRIYRVTGR